MEDERSIEVRGVVESPADEGNGDERECDDDELDSMRDPEACVSQPARGVGETPAGVSAADVGVDPLALLRIDRMLPGGDIGDSDDSKDSPSPFLFFGRPIGSLTSAAGLT